MSSLTGCVVGKMDREPDLNGLASAAEESQQNDGTTATTTESTSNDDSTPPMTAAGEEWTGYIGMLAVRENYRRQGIGKELVRRVLHRMKEWKCSSATLETEVTNTTAQKLYQESFGFVREELLVRYYLNWNDAYRLRLWF